MSANQSNHVLVIDLDERGSFKGHVEDPQGHSIFEFSNEEEASRWPNEMGLWLIEDGYMSHGRDVDGLRSYLQDMDIMPTGATLVVQG